MSTPKPYIDENSTMNDSNEDFSFSRNEISINRDAKRPDLPPNGDPPDDAVKKAVWGPDGRSFQDSSAQESTPKRQATRSPEIADHDRQWNIGMILLGGVVAIVTLAALVPLGGLLLFSFAMSAEEEFQTAPSPDGQHQLQVHSTPAFGYGSHGVILRAKAQRKTLSQYETHLSNDGKNLDPSNIQVYWQSNTVAHICLRGEEQTPAGILLTLLPQEDRPPKTKATFTENPTGCLF